MHGTRLIRIAVAALVLAATPLLGTIPAGAQVRGNEGCTPGYWKNHPAAWADTGQQTPFNPSQTVASVWPDVNDRFPGLGDDTLMQALSYKGGSGLEGMARNLLRHAVAALLNASVDGVDYSYWQNSVINQTNDALATGSRSAMEALKNTWAAANERGCPL
jgi:hypothetical protein